MSEEVTAVVLDFVRKEYLEDGDDRVIDATTPLITGGIVDSFSMVTLLYFVEAKYAIRIPDSDATPEAFDSVEKIVALIDRVRRGA